MSELKGYHYNNCSLRTIRKDRYVLSPKIESQVRRGELNAQMWDILSGKGRVYFLTRKKEVCLLQLIYSACCMPPIQIITQILYHRLFSCSKKKNASKF